MPMKLINLNAWSKITYTYGVIGPEIMFFCQDNNIVSNFKMPDLDPITISVRQFTQQGAEMLIQINDPMNIQGNTNEFNMSNQEGLRILLSKFITLNTFKNYAKTHLNHLMSELVTI